MPGEQTRGVARAAAEPADLSGHDLLLPSLLAGLDAADERTRKSGAYASILLARENESAMPDVVAALVERAAGDRPRPACVRTLATLDADHAETVQRAILDALDREAARSLYRSVKEAEPWDVPDDLGAVEAAGGEFATDFRQLIRPDRDGRDRDDAEARSLPVERDTGETPETGPSGAAGHRTSSGEPSGGTAGGADDAVARTANSQVFTAIQMRSDFETLEPLAGEERRRYGSVVRARGEIDGQEHGVALRLFHRPSDRSGAFDSAVAEALQAWQGLAEAPGIVTVFDWGEQPRPWVATEYVEQTLAGADRPPVEQALGQARRLTGALARAHQQDTVHGGLDPRDLAFSEAALEDGQRPLLDNFGLVPACRPHGGTGTVLDPRYSAPEHVDDQFGGVDHATDIYGLGMVLYRLTTGHAPFAGHQGDVREAVCRQRPTPPSEVCPDLPGALDEVVARATSKKKLTRYETAQRFHQDVCKVHDRVSQ